MYKYIYIYIKRHVTREWRGVGGLLCHFSKTGKLPEVGEKMS